MSGFFVTGGSGFIGRNLLRRLHGEGHSVRALARSDSAAEAVAEQGAEPVRGALDDEAAIRAGAEGCEYAIHAAATLGDWGRTEDFERGNVLGTGNALRACAEAGVPLRARRHRGRPAGGAAVGERRRDRAAATDSPALYSATKARAEMAVRAANREGFKTVVVRPRFVWGAGDTTLLPSIVELVRSGRFA